MLSVAELITTPECRKITQVTAREVGGLEVERTLVTKIKLAPMMAQCGNQEKWSGSRADLEMSW